MFVLVNLGAVIFTVNPSFVMDMPNGNNHKKGFLPEPPEACDLFKERILLHCCCAPCSTAIIEWMVGAGLHPGIFFSNSNIVPFREYSIRRDELCRYAAAHGLETIDDEYDHAAWLAFVRRLENYPPTAMSSPSADPQCPCTDLISPVAEPVEAPGCTEATLPPVSEPTPSVVEPVEAPRQCRNRSQNPHSRSLSLSKRLSIRIADMPERGPRCLECFKFRLLRAARYASAHGYTLLTTTLASSRWKDLEQVDAAGRWACGEVNGFCLEMGSGLESERLVSWDLSRNRSGKDVYGLESEQDVTMPVSGGKVLWWSQNWRKGGLQERRNALIKEWNMYNQTFCGCEFSERH